MIKREKGDLATPEGLYRVRDKHPSRKYYLFIALDYPNLKDIKRTFWEGRIDEKTYRRYLSAYRKGETFRGPLGNDIGIHGGGLYRPGKSRRVRNWTYGCIALRNEDLEKVYRFVRIGTPVLILDSRRTFFEILREIAVPEFEDRETWQSRLTVTLSRYWLDLDILLSARKDGARRIEIVGMDLPSKTPLFYIRDLNGNGVLEPLDRWYSRHQTSWGGYRFLQTIILESLPQELTSFTKF